MFVLLVIIVLGLIGWINQDYAKKQWVWYTVTLPYARSHARPYVLSAAKERALRPGDSFKECAQDCPEMIVIPAGSFVMGSLREGAASFMMGGPNPAGQPLHTVGFAKAFVVSKYDVTFADWDACVAGGGCEGYKPNDEGWGGDGSRS